MSHHEHIPVGAVLPYAGPLANTDVDAGAQAQIRANLASTGWLYCDGAKLDRRQYGHLFGVLGFAYGKDGDNYFHLPDLRGRFIRGVNGTLDADDNQAARDPCDDKRIASQAGGNAANMVGSLQLDSLQGHEHDYQGVSNTVVPPAPVLGPGDAPTYSIGKEVTKSDVTDGTDGDPRVSSETRPVNLYMNYIIRYR